MLNLVCVRRAFVFSYGSMCSVSRCPNQIIDFGRVVTDRRVLSRDDSKPFWGALMDRTTSVIRKTLESFKTRLFPAI